MKDCFVIFDTNAYRNFCIGKTTSEVKSEIQDIKEKERDLNIKALMSPIVAMEILSHLSDSTKREFEPSKKAIIAQYGHCSEDDSFKIIASPDMILCYTLFGQKLPKKKLYLDIIGNVAFEIWKDEGIYSINKNISFLKEIHFNVQNDENEFAQSMFEAIRSIDNNTTNFHLFSTDDNSRKEFLLNINSDKFDQLTALGFVMKSYKTLFDYGIITNINPEADLKPHINLFQHKFKASIELYRELYKRIVNTEFDINKKSRANFLWDILLLLTVGDEDVNCEKLYFITDDKAIQIASGISGHGIKVLTLKDYLREISDIP